MAVNGALFEHVPIVTLEMLRHAATLRTGVQRDRPTNMQSAPDIKLSPSEKWTLQKIAEGEFPIRELDWLALQRLKKLGLVEDRRAGVGITKEGRTMLRRLTLPS